MNGSAALEPLTLVGLGLVAVWAYVRYPRLRPASLTRAVAHVALSFGLFTALPALVTPVLSLGRPFGVALFVIALLLPILTYVLFSWLGLMAKIRDLADSTPRGGHPVRGTAG